MPIRPRKEIQKRTGVVTGPELENLILGFSFFDDPFKNDQERRKCWKKHRTFIMSLQGKPARGEVFGLSSGNYFDLLTRPAAFWAYDAPGGRRFISCSNDFCPYFAECGPAKNIPTESPDCIIRAGSFKSECVGHDFKIYEPARETEAEFLQRHGLLNETEKQYIEATKRDE